MNHSTILRRLRGELTQKDIAQRIGIKRSAWAMYESGARSPRDETKEVAEAILHGAPILIDGDRSKATGKSTLCGALRVLGAEVYEGWELEEGEKKPDATRNHIFVFIQLNEGIWEI